MKKIKLLLVATVFMTGSIAFGQDLQVRAQDQTSKYVEKYKLTEEQKSKVYEINLGIESKNDAIKNDVNMSAETKQQALKGNLDAREQMIQSVLTSEQKELGKVEEVPMKQITGKPKRLKFD